MLKVDLVMWTFNGAETLGLVLNRINRVVPKEHVHNRFIVDDGSTDETREVAVDRGWIVIFNEGCGVADGANTALKHVGTKYFCSFEQDLLLSFDWWKQVFPMIKREGVAAACGVRHQYPSVCMRRLHEYGAERYAGWLRGLPVYLGGEARLKAAMSYGRTLDNTVYNTEVLRSVGGFPRLEVNGGVDTVLTYLLVKAGYEWPVNFDVESLHLGKDFWSELKCQYNYGTCYDEIARYVPGLPSNLRSQAMKLLYSPLAALRPAFKKRCPSILFAYPLLRFYVLRGLLDSRKGKRWSGH